MASPNAMTRNKAAVVPPEKGSFPIDHFKECKDIINRYLVCVSKHEKIPKRCQKLQVEYLNCRMEKGLMNKEPIEKLGYTKQNSYENELEVKKGLFEKFLGIDQESKKTVQDYYKNEYSESSQ